MKPLPFLLCCAVAVPAWAAPPPPGREEVSIPFVTHPRAIRSFNAPSDDLLYLRDRQGRWYRAEISGPCIGLSWANAIGYDTRGSLSLSRGGSILVEGQRCLIVSLTRGEPPPRRRGKKPAAQAGPSIPTADFSPSCSCHRACPRPACGSAARP
jgi:hypothetical protein